MQNKWFRILLPHAIAVVVFLLIAIDAQVSSPQYPAKPDLRSTYCLFPPVDRRLSPG